MTGHIRLLYIILPACFLLAACTAPILDKEEKFTCLIGDCMGLGYWRDIDVVPRYEMLQALLLAYERVPEWRPIAKRAAVMGTKFRVATAVMAQARGEYNGFHTVIISPNELSDHTVILASILGHEVSHAGSENIHGPHTFNIFQQYDSEDCYQEEAHAYVWTAVIYDKLSKEFPVPSSERSQQMEFIVRNWRQDTLLSMAKSHPTHRYVCDR